MPVTHKFTSSKPDGSDNSLIKPSNWNDTHNVSISNVDVDSDAGIEESKLALNNPTHPPVTLGVNTNGLGLSGQELSLGLADSDNNGALSATDWDTFNNKLSVAPVVSVNSQTGVVVLDPDDLDDTLTTHKFTNASDISKLAGIEAGAEVNNISDVNATDLTDGGETTLHSHPSAGGVDSVNGQTGTVVLDPDDLDDMLTTHKFTTSSDISKLAGIEANATKYPDTGEEVYSSAEKTKLAGIEAAADVTDNANVAAAIEAGSSFSIANDDKVPYRQDTTGQLKYEFWSNLKLRIKAYADGIYSALGHTHSYAPTTRNIGTTAPLSGGGDLSADRTLSIGANSVDVSYMHSGATDKVFGRSSAGAGAGEEIAMTAAGRALVDDVSAADQRTTLGLGTIATYAEGDYIPINDWISASTWTYASASTFTVSGDVTAIYRAGTRLKWTQTTVKYGVVVSSSYSSPNTTVTIAVNSNYTIANAAISSNSYSHITNPEGYPDWFDFVSTFTGFSSAPTVVFRYSIIGHTCIVNVATTGNGTSNANTFTFTIPVTSKNISGYYQYGTSPYAINNSAAIGTALCFSTANSNVITVATQVGGASSWSTTNGKSADVKIFVEF